jgi:hypothetical protein
MRDGRRFSQRVSKAAGRTSQNPLPVARIESKFIDCASHALSVEASRELLAMLWRIDELDDLASVSDLLERGIEQDVRS